MLQLDRPVAKNALGETLLQQLHDRIEELQFDGCVRFPWRYPFFCLITLYLELKAKHDA